MPENKLFSSGFRAPGLLLMACLCSIASLKAQSPFSWKRLADLPIPISNNAVVSAKAGSNTYVYSFGGISSGRTYKSITKKCFRYNPASNSWDSIPDLPSKEALVAMAASEVRDTIYICGGYSVDSLGNEKTNEKLFRFVPAINSFIKPGADVPVPTDDQVQVVWKDSLIYLISGWSTNRNISEVQVYNPVSSSWSQADPVPANNRYMSFGASGVFIGDTIYYLGGAAFVSNFRIQNILRMGVVDPLDPLKIIWSTPNSSTPFTGYRMASLSEDSHPIWIGGSSVTYNYDGIAYNGTGPVSPEDRTLVYLQDRAELRSYSNSGHGVMDLRGIANLGGGKYIVCGGMEAGPGVTSECWQLDYNNVYLGRPTDDNATIEAVLVEKVYYLPAGISSDTRYEIYQLNGQLVKIHEVRKDGLQINLEELSAGCYLIKESALSEATAIRILILR